jgi:type II secretory pathway component PulF
MSSLNHIMFGAGAFNLTSEDSVLGVLIGLALTPLAAALVFGLFYLIYYLFSLPMRRREQTRLFLDLIERGLQHGQSIEQTIVGLARSGDRSLGDRFRILARRMEQGIGFAQAIQLPPEFLPAETVAMLKAGAEAGDVAKVLPACREASRDGVEEVWKAQHYLALLAFVVTPAWAVVFTMLMVFVVPKLRMIAQDMGAEWPFWLTALVGQRFWLIAAEILLVLGFWFLALLYIGGPRWWAWFARSFPRSVPGLVWRLPWRRKRMQRAFSATLAVLLDAGMPEARAVILAAEAADNEPFTRRARAAVAELERGVSLTEALRQLDSAGEFRWRVANAARSGHGFRAALAGWHEALAARAFQQEQTAAQLLTTGLLLFNGLLVGVLAAGLFQMLTNLVDAGTLW